MGEEKKTRSESTHELKRRRKRSLPTERERFAHVLHDVGKRLPRTNSLTHPTTSQKRERAAAAAAARGAPFHEIKGTQFGMRTAAFETTRDIAFEENVRIQLRPTNLESARWIRAGFSKKPHDVVTKSIGPLDTALGMLMRAGGMAGGPAAKTEGLIGFYKPMSEGELDALFEANKGKLPGIKIEDLEKKRKARADEYEQNKASINKLGAQVPPVVRRGRGEYEGLLLDARPPERAGHAQLGENGYFHPFTGDFDGFDISEQDENGQWVSLAEAKKYDPGSPRAQRYDHILARLMASSTVQSQHGYQLAWDEAKDAALQKPNDPEGQKALLETYLQITKGVLDKHKPGGEPLIDIFPDGQAQVSFYEK